MSERELNRIEVLSQITQGRMTVWECVSDSAVSPNHRDVHTVIG